MKKQEEDEITSLYNESLGEASDSARPQYLVFAEKIINRELELTAKLLCFQCAEGHKVEKREKGDGWIHKIHGTSGYVLIETCRANVVRMRRE